MKKNAKLVALWFWTSFALAPILFVLVPGLLGLILSSGTIQERLNLFVIGITFPYLWVLALFYAVVGALPYLGVLIGWVYFARHDIVMEKSKLNVAVFTAVLAATSGLIVAVAINPFARPLEALKGIFSLFLLVWGTLLLPRLIFGSLAPGVFNDQSLVSSDSFHKGYKKP